MSDTQKLLPCPFCNGEASLRTGGPGLHFVQCDTCNCTSDDGSEERVVKAWNRRASPPEDNRLALADAVLREACRVVDADTYKHPILSRADAVAAGVAGLHDAVRAWQSAQPPCAALSHGEDDNGK